MSENAIPGDEVPSGSAEDTADNPKWARAVAFVVFAGLLVAVVAWWRPWESSESLSPSCVEDASHFIDEESGLCYAVPDRWVSNEAVLDAEVTSAFVAPNEAAWVMVWPVPANTAAMSVEEAAHHTATLYSGYSPELPNAIEAEPGSIDGRDSASAEFEVGVAWYLVTVIQLDGGKVAVVGSSLSGESGLIRMVEEVHDSLGVQ